MYIYCIPKGAASCATEDVTEYAGVETPEGTIF